MRCNYYGELPRNKVEQGDRERFSVLNKVRKGVTKNVALNKNLMQVRKQTTGISGERAFLTEEGASANVLR